MADIPEIKPYCVYKGNLVFSKKAVQLLLGVSEKTLERYVALGKIAARKVGIGRYSVAFYERDIDAFLARKK